MMLANQKAALNRQGGGLPIQMRHEQMAFDPSVPTFYGDTPPLFDLCASEALVSLSYVGRTSPLIDWMGFESTTIQRIQEVFLSYVAPSGAAAGAPTNGWITDPCEPGEGVEWGTCDFFVEGFGRLRRSGPVREATELDIRYCERQPRYRVDGTLIEDELEWDMVTITSALLHDLHRMLVVGNRAVTGQFDGLQQLVNFGYTDSNGNPCTAMDSFVIDWNGNPVADVNNAPNGVTFNGNALTLGTGVTFIDVLESVVRRIQQRIRLSDGFNGSIEAGDMVLALPGDAIECLLDAYTCHRICGNDITRMDSYEARQFRRNLEGGIFGDGQITISNVDIPLLSYDYELLDNTGQLADIYLLTRGVGGTTFLRGQYNDLSNAVQRLGPQYDWTDNGLFMNWETQDNTCIRRHMEMQPRVLCRAPWAQARFTNVQCTGLLGAPITGDPLSQFFIEGNLVAQS